MEEFLDGELFEEFDFILVEETNIADTISDHRKTSETESEGKTRIFLGVYICLSEDIWMDETTAHKFEPATFAILFPPEIDLHAWLHKREIPRTHTETRFVAEEFCENGGDGSLEMTDVDIFVDDESFHLFKSYIMRCIDLFIPIDRPEHHRTEWLWLCLQEMILHA